MEAFPATTSKENVNNGYLQHGPLPSPSSLDKLPYLSAVLKESYRMRPNSTPLPRITPSDRSVTLAGIEGIPPGTRVNSFQWFVHRNPNKWAQVHQFVPERWLETNEEDQEANNKVLWAFGSGPRMCVGSHLTQYGISLRSFLPYMHLLWSTECLGSVLSRLSTATYC